MYMRTRKVICPNCKKPFRPGGPWPADDPELPTAKQASEKFELGRNFANKLWNAARFILLNLEGYQPAAIRIHDLPIEDRWILSRLATTTAAVMDQLENYHFSEAARTIYDFTWSEFCDWYLEMSKGRLREAASRPLVQRVLVGVLDTILRLVHPIMPFVAESIWQALAEVAFERGVPAPEPAAESVVIAPWPELPKSWIDLSTERSLKRMQEAVSTFREFRTRPTIRAKSNFPAHIPCKSDQVASAFQSQIPFIQQLAGVGEVDFSRESPTFIKEGSGGLRIGGSADYDIYVPRTLVDIEQEIKRLERDLLEKRKSLQTAQGKLENPNFVAKAPADVIQQQKDLAVNVQEQIETIEKNLMELRRQ
jgi:valyl-tRNA synthetase